MKRPTKLQKQLRYLLPEQRRKRSEWLVAYAETEVALDRMSDLASRAGVGSSSWSEIFGLSMEQLGEALVIGRMVQAIQSKDLKR